MIVRITLVLLFATLIASCGGGSSSTSNEPNPVPPPITPPPTNVQPTLSNVVANAQSIALYEKIEWSIDANAQYDNPFDSRDVSLSALLTAPNGNEITVAGYWDTRRGWKIRFSPSLIGQWQFAMTITDGGGTSDAVAGEFTVTQSTSKGMIKVANQINPDYSPRYFLHQDGSEFYGIGHSDTFAIFRNSDTADRFITTLKNANENYYVWWPQYYFPITENTYQNFHLANVEVIDEVIEKTEQADLKLVFTIWDHSQLRDNSHPWSDGRWQTHNGFRQLTSATDFFTNEEAWQWQQNLYRYIIARWGHSPAIAMWQTVSEIDGTNAFENANAWHQKVNEYFKTNDPYQHPTTGSMAGDKTWPEGHRVMDAPQVHIYRDLLTNRDDTRSPAKVIESASIIANYTQNMWQENAKPNWIGEFGVINHPVNQGQNYYPEVFHQALWSALAAGAAMTPAEWNDFSDWGQLTSSMITSLQHFATFVDRLSLAKWQPKPLEITSPTNTKTWGIAGEQGGMIWLQDTTLQGETITAIRQQRLPTAPLSIEVNNLPAGDYQITPYNTQQGEFLTPLSLTCQTNIPCLIAVPAFLGDIALLITR